MGKGHVCVKTGILLPPSQFCCETKTVLKKKKKKSLKKYFNSKDNSPSQALTLKGKHETKVTM